ncbi:MAG: SDR family NAD(P)-dependent oxidoreductase, partial [Solirubrobacterales bacterium]|nr:SDR family NAD(P)-dependent oxidoreductase [Solirubrobacterales bacterium]
MPQTEAPLTLAAPPALPLFATAEIAGWGGGPPASVRLGSPRTREDFPAALATARAMREGRRGVISRGMGRSYGDAAQRRGGVVISTRGLTGVELDAERGSATVEAGLTIGELLDQAVPAGWMVPVVPGTQHVSIGGAIASDIHGKNHRTAGTFGGYVEALGLLTAGGEVLELAADSADPIFAATLGGMGLTGMILWARIRLRRISGPLLAVDADRVETLDEALEALLAPGGSYRVAWLDLLGAQPGRGIVTRAEHVSADQAAGADGSPTVRSRATVPSAWPRGVLRPSTVRAFNELRFRSAPRRQRDAIESIGAHMFPLDALEAWPRLYGPAGFVQYQLVVPFGAESVLHETIAHLRQAEVPCYLAVLKDFGEANAAPLSFPAAGWTLALDLPRAAPGLEAALDHLDQRVAEAGGRVYLTKDARARPEVLAAMYPRLEEWRRARDTADPDRVWRSDLAERTGLVESEPTPGPGSGAPAPAPAASPASATPGLAQRVLLLGGTSEIGLAIVRRLMQDGPVRPFLVGRDRERLGEALASLERAGGVSGEVEVLDADELAEHERAISRAFQRAEGFDVVILAVGVLGAQAGLDAARDEALEVMRVNFVGAGSLLLECLRRLREQGGGTLVALSSVGAERPRASNAIYAAAKAGLDALAQGLADATAGTGVRVLVVRPGFVTTKMTQGLEPAPMATTP